MKMSTEEPAHIRQELCLRADRDYKAGELILRKKPFTHVVRDKGLSCDNCLRKPSDDGQLLKCGNCRKFFYCSKQCQLEDWKNAHKYKECLLYKADPNSMLLDLFPVEGAYLREVLRDFLKILARPDLANEKVHTIDGQSVSYMDLQGHVEKRERFHIRPLLRIIYKNQSEDARKLNNYLMEKTGQHDWWESDLLDQISGRIQTNAVSGKSYFRECGTVYALDIELSLMNHSCRPNVICTIEKGPFLIIRALADIAKGEELFMSYIDIKAPREVRRRAISSYYFTCQCQRCSIEFETDEVLLKTKEEKFADLNRTDAPLSISDSNRSSLEIIGLNRKLFGEYCVENVIILQTMLLVNPPNSQEWRSLYRLLVREVLVTFGPKCPLLDQSDRVTIMSFVNELDSSNNDL